MSTHLPRIHLIRSSKVFDSTSIARCVHRAYCGLYLAGDAQATETIGRTSCKGCIRAFEVYCRKIQATGAPKGLESELRATRRAMRTALDEIRNELLGQGRVFLNDPHINPQERLATLYFRNQKALNRVNEALRQLDYRRK